MNFSSTSSKKTNTAFQDGIGNTKLLVNPRHHTSDMLDGRTGARILARLADAQLATK